VFAGKGYRISILSKFTRRKIDTKGGFLRPSLFLVFDPRLFRSTSRASARVAVAIAKIDSTGWIEVWVGMIRQEPPAEMVLVRDRIEHSSVIIPYSTMAEASAE
jgi:hypothetical protein